MTNLRNIALNMLSRNPNIANNPRNQEMISVLQSGDAKRGQEIANNLLQSYGMTKEEAMQQARSTLSQRFGLPL